MVTTVTWIDDPAWTRFDIPAEHATVIVNGREYRLAVEDHGDDYVAWSLEEVIPDAVTRDWGSRHTMVEAREAAEAALGDEIRAAAAEGGR